MLTGAVPVAVTENAAFPPHWMVWPAGPTLMPAGAESVCVETNVAVLPAVVDSGVTVSTADDVCENVAADRRKRERKIRGRSNWQRSHRPDNMSRRITVTG